MATSPESSTPPPEQEQLGTVWDLLRTAGNPIPNGQGGLVVPHPFIEDAGWTQVDHNQLRTTYGSRELSIASIAIDTSRLIGLQSRAYADAVGLEGYNEASEAKGHLWLISNSDEFSRVLEAARHSRDMFRMAVIIDSDVDQVRLIGQSVTQKLFVNAVVAPHTYNLTPIASQEVLPQHLPTLSIAANPPQSSGTAH